MPPFPFSPRTDPGLPGRSPRGYNSGMARSGTVFLVAGARGFVGGAVVRRLRESGAAVRCLLRPGSPAGGREWLEPPVETVTASVDDPAGLRRAMHGCDMLINCLGLNSFWEADRAAYLRANVEATRALMLAALDETVGKVVHVSTVMAYGFPAVMPFTEDSEPGPCMSEYARSKHEGDLLAEELQKSRGLPLVQVFLAAVVGRGDPKSVMQIRQFTRGGVPLMIRSGNRFSYVDIADAATAIVRAAEKEGNVGRRYLVGAERLTTEEYFRIISEASGVPMPRRSIGRGAGMALSGLLTGAAAITRRPPLMPLDLIRTVYRGSLLFDGEKAARELGFAYRPIRESLADAVAEARETTPGGSLKGGRV
jgi:dihydroflavonol-4-reductase